MYTNEKGKAKDVLFSLPLKINSFAQFRTNNELNADIHKYPLDIQK